MASVVRHDHMLDPMDEVHGYGVRDPFRGSVASIIEDPFFRNYQSPQSAALSKELHTSSHISHDLDDDRHAADKGGYSAKATWDQVTSQAGLNNINIAVLGATGVGKSSLIQRALGLRHPPHSTPSHTKMVIENIKYTINLFEIDLKHVDFRPDQRVEWPKQINGHGVPRVDGALVLFDVMNSESIVDVPQTLNALIFSALPTILVSCKCDNPVNTHQIRKDSIKAACMAEIETVKTASNVPESARHCLGVIISSIMTTRKSSGPQDIFSAENGSPISSISGSSFDDTDDDDFDLNPHSFLRGFPSPPASGSRTPTSPTMHLDQIVIPATKSAPPSAAPIFRHDIFDTSATGRQGGKHGEESGLATANAASVGKERASLPVIDESDAELSRQHSDDNPVLQRSEELVSNKPKLPGFSLEDLVQRLLSRPMTKADADFSDIFLLLYRKFVAPGELMWTIMRQYDILSEDESLHYLTKTEDQLRLVGVIAKWVTTYPGDFVGEHTRYRLDSLIKRLSSLSPFASAVQDMQNVLQSSVIEDEDADWARKDTDMVWDLEQGLPFPCQAAAVELLNWKKAGGGEPNAETPEQDLEMIPSNERRPSVAPSMTPSMTSSYAISLTTSSNSTYNSIEDYQAEAATMEPTSTMPLTEFRYKICMDIKDDDLAEEITRIDWIMFSSIRIRDLVCHVSLPLDKKEKCKSLAHVNRMIYHFNHVAHWVANMILMRPKAKQRALMLEKFMKVAIRLRQLNNYNGLAAVIAGINGSPVHRLTRTRALVPEECQKRFLALELLMSAEKSHVAYRLAWENSSLPRIPFIPLHRRDLVSAEDETRPWAGLNRINWKHFENLSEVLLPIMRSQGVPYPKLERSDIARELILDCRMPTDEEEILSRSLLLESESAPTTPDHSKKRFPWFHKSV